MKRISLFLVLFTLIVLFASATLAQDFTPTPEPTIAPPVVIVNPSPIDTGAIPSSAFLVIIVSVLGVVVIAGVGIVQAAKLMPEWARPIITSGINSGIDQLDNYAKGTPSTIDDDVVAELRARVLELEKQMNDVPAQTRQAIQTNNVVQMQSVQKMVGNAPTTQTGS